MDFTCVTQSQPLAEQSTQIVASQGEQFIVSWQGAILSALETMFYKIGQLIPATKMDPLLAPGRGSPPWADQEQQSCWAEV
jgi:hypothetical protein